MHPSGWVPVMRPSVLPPRHETKRQVWAKASVYFALAIDAPPPAVPRETKTQVSQREKTQTTSPLTLAGHPPTHPGRPADLPKYDPIVGHGVWNGMG